MEELSREVVQFGRDVCKLYFRKLKKMSTLLHRPAQRINLHTQNVNLTASDISGLGGVVYDHMSETMEREFLEFSVDNLNSRSGNHLLMQNPVRVFAYNFMVFVD